MEKDAKSSKAKKQVTVETSDCPDEANKPGKGRDCPRPGHMCEAINDYMCWWHEWALKVHDQLWPAGNPDDPDPPPWPPFKTS